MLDPREKATELFPVCPDAVHLTEVTGQCRKEDTQTRVRKAGIRWAVLALMEGTNVAAAAGNLSVYFVHLDGRDRFSVYS